MSNIDFQYLASGPDNEPVTSLVLCLHGYGRNATYMAKTAIAIREQVPGSLVICPHGMQQMNTGVMGHARDHQLHIPQEVVEGNDGNPPEMMREWFQIDGQRDSLMPRLRDAAERLNAFIDVQRDMFGLDDKRIVLMGFSQGGGTALYTAYTRRSEIAALVCHSSIVIDRETTDNHLRSKPQTLFLYGENDPEFKQETYHKSFQWVDQYTINRAVERIIPKIGHYTSTESRKVTAAYIRDVLK